jgi:fructose/tagatose bisphosphate aldolase
MASTGAVRKHLIENTANFDPRKFLKEATNAMSAANRRIATHLPQCFNIVRNQ